MSPDLARALVAEAALSPSVHNVQPARWRFMDDAVLLFEDTRRRIPAGDPTGRDTRLSLGSAIEGLSLALSARDLGLEATELPATPGLPDYIQPVSAFRIVKGAADPLQPAVAQRYSYRGLFAAPSPADRDAAAKLATDDVAVIAKPGDLARVGAAYDAASLRFFRDPAFRAELVSWMRLSPRHPRWALDGLNAEAMAMSPFEATGAGIVLGPQVFPVLDTLGLSGPLTAEAAKVTGAAAVLVLHRPDSEDGLVTGRAFHRAWLRFVSAGFHGAVMAAVADDDAARAEIGRIIGLSKGRRIITTFRIGHGDVKRPQTARLPVDDLLI